MKILGFEIKKAAPKTDRPPSSAQTRVTSPQGAMTPYFQDYVLRKVSGEFYEVLREGIPIIDSAIRRLISLNGTIKIIGDNPGLVVELEDFCRSVPVNDTQKGIHAFLENASNETFEQGFSISEFIATPDFKDIAGLRVADSKQIVYRRNGDGKAEPWYRNPGYQPWRILSRPEQIAESILTATYQQAVFVNGMYEIKLNPSNLIYLSINNENSDPYGISIMRSMEFVSKILMTMQNSLLNVWERFGDPMYSVLLTTVNKTDAAARKTTLLNDFTAVINAKRLGKSADLVNVIGKEDKLEIKVIGSDNQELTMDVPARHVLEQIVSKTNLPAWMLGIYWSTTERMATLEVESALQDAKIRQLAMTPEFIRLFSTVLAVRKKTWKTITTDPNKPGDWGFYFETPNLRDVMAMANARFLNAQAELMERGGTAPPTATNVTVGQATFALPPKPETQNSEHKTAASCSCGHLSSSSMKSISANESAKELSRPFPWPQLDKIEGEYEAELKYDWIELQKKIFKILDLTVPEKVQHSGVMGKESASTLHPGPWTLDPGAKGFSYSDSQRDSIFKALKDYLGYYDPSDPDSTIKWYYGQSYSLGLIQAANLMGKERPLLDILKNREIFDEITSNGFQLVRDNATTSIKSDIIASMERAVVNGNNPRDVATELNALFWDKNSDWERLARTEMGSAAERAKKDEWDERGVDTTDFVNGPADIHPRCRCSNTVVQIDGKWVARFVPAPDACPQCFAAAAGS